MSRTEHESERREPIRLAHHEGRRRVLKYTERGASALAIAGLGGVASLLAVCAIWSVRLILTDVEHRLSNEVSGQEPLWVVGAFGYSLTLFCLAMIGDRVLMRIRGWRIRRLKPHHPDEPWRWDYRWNPRAVHVSGVGFRLANLFGLTVPVAFWSLINMGAWDTWHPVVPCDPRDHLAWVKRQ